MKIYLAMFFAVSAIASAAAFATQAEYDKCMKMCAKKAITPEDKVII